MCAISSRISFLRAGRARGSARTSRTGARIPSCVPGRGPLETSRATISANPARSSADRCVLPSSSACGGPSCSGRDGLESASCAGAARRAYRNGSGPIRVAEERPPQSDQPSGRRAPWIRSRPSRSSIQWNEDAATARSKSSASSAVLERRLSGCRRGRPGDPARKAASAGSARSRRAGLHPARGVAASPGRCRGRSRARSCRAAVRSARRGSRTPRPRWPGRARS